MKRPNLAANVKAAAGDMPEASPATPAKRVLVPANGARSAEGKRSLSREGRKAIYAWVDPAEHMKLKRLALDSGRSIDALVAEGMELLFSKHGVR